MKDDLYTVWHWRNIAKVALLWLGSVTLMVGIVSVFHLGSVIAVALGILSGAGSVGIGNSIWRCYHFDYER